MGINVCCTHNIQAQQQTIVFPVMAYFIPAQQPPHIQTQHQFLFDKLKKRLPVVDCLRDTDLQWFRSVKYNIYLYGALQRERPFGNCFFYCEDDSIPNAPIIIATNVDQHYVFCSQTLIIYPEDLVYYGSIKNDLSALPRAEGNGMLFSPHFIYEGQFKNGCPHGFGHYRSRTMEYVGDFKNGEPCGQGLQKTAEQLFIGTIGEKGKRKGFKITRRNEKVEVADTVGQGSAVRSKLNYTSDKHI